MSSTPARIAIVEDDVILRDWLVAVVGDLPGLSVVAAVGTCAAGRALIEAAATDTPIDVLLCDLALPDGTGLDLIALASAKGIKVLVISIFGDVTNVVRAIEQGAVGYLLKGEREEQVATSIRTVLAGGAPISPAVAGHLLARMRQTAGPTPGPAAPGSSSPGASPASSSSSAAARRGEPGVSLTHREVEVLGLLAKGLSYREVADVHGISHHTVADHVKSIYRKLQVNSKSEAVFEAVQNGLLRL